MKKILLLLASAALLLVGCGKEQIVAPQEGGMTTVSFTANLENGVATKAFADNDGAAASVNRCIMEIYYGNELFTRQYAKVNEQKKASFTVQVVSNRTYKVAFWADHVDATTDAGLQVDKYYTTNATGGLQAITIKGDYIGNDDARDAFAFCKEYTIAQAGSAFQATLTRPFAQINVITTDVATVKKVSSLVPEKVDVTLKNVATAYNVLDSTAVAGSTGDLNYSADIYKWDANMAECTLSMDYIFAEKEKSTIDIDWKALHGNDAAVEHIFAAIPYQRNYRTNIKGALLTTQGQWTVEVDPQWAVSDIDFPVYEATVDNIASLNTVLASEKAQAAGEVIVTTTMPNDSNTKEVVFTTVNNEQVVSLTFKDGLGTDKTINFKNDQESTQGPANLNIVAPSGTNLVFNNPMTHVVINGTSYDNISGTFSANTLVINKGVHVAKIDMKAGGLEIHGTVDNLTVSGTQQTVFVRSCENLNSSVYAVAKQYIAEGYVADDETNSIIKKDFVQDENGVWHVMNAKAYNEFAAAVNGGVTFEHQIVVLDEDIDFHNATVAPIGNFTDNTPFKGTFDGNNKKLSNFTVQNVTGKMGVGIFGKVYAPCVIKDLVVEGATVIGDKETAGDKAIAYVGGIAGHGYATIQNCTFKGEIYAGHQMGGIAGSGGFTITGCTFEGNIISERDWGLGGIIGNCQDGGAISGNTAKGTISAKNANYCGFIAGGIIGCAIYTTYDVKDNYAAMSMSYDGVAFENVYPIVGVYNIDGSEEDKSITDFAKLLDHLANNTWDKTISPKDSYSILYNNENPTSTGYDINYGAATTKAPAAMIGDTGYETLQAAFDAVPDGIETTITLNSDATYATLGNKNNIGAKTVILNLNGHSITGHMRGVSALTNYNSLDGATLVNYANLTINGEGTIGDLEGEYHHNALVNMSDGTNLTINGGTFVAKSCCVYHYSASSEANTASININGGTFKEDLDDPTNKYVFGIGGKSGQTLTFNYKDATSEGAKGIYCSLAGTTINIHSGSIIADISAINLSGGNNVTINIDGGKLKTLDSENHANNYKTTGSYTTSLPIYASGGSNIVCNISGGEFIYPYYSWQLSGTIPATWERVINAGVGLPSNVANANITASLTGGTYSTNQMLSDITNDQSEASGIVAQGYTCKDNGDGTWTVKAEN